MNILRGLRVHNVVLRRSASVGASCPSATAISARMDVSTKLVPTRSMATNLIFHPESHAALTNFDVLVLCISSKDRRVAPILDSN